MPCGADGKIVSNCKIVGGCKMVGTNNVCRAGRAGRVRIGCTAIVQRLHDVVQRLARVRGRFGFSLGFGLGLSLHDGNAHT